MNTASAVQLSVAGCLAIVAASAIGITALTSTAGPAPVVRFDDCARAVDPPSCLVERVASLSSDDDIAIFDATVQTGAVSFARTHAALLVDAAQGRGKSKRFILYALQGRRYPGSEQLRAATATDVAAAIAVATAAQVVDDPFTHVDVLPLLLQARHKTEVAQIATMIWEERDAAYLWRNASIRPRGIGTIWRVAASAPPTDVELLAELADRAENWGAAADAASLARRLLMQGDATADQRRSATRIVEQAGGRRTRPSADEIAALINGALKTCMQVLTENGYQASRCAASLGMLREFEAKRELLQIADAYLNRARESQDKPEYKTAWFGLASEAYRLAEDRERALAAAREGLPFVPAAVRSHWVGMPAPPMNTNEERRHAAAFIGDGATQPVVQLYRAGAREEALQTGFLTGYHRYTNAAVAGEAANPRWLVEDRQESVIERVIGDLLRDPNQAVANAVYEGLLCDGPSFYGPHRIAVLERTLAVLAAMAGQRASVSVHLARAIEQTDREADASYRVQLVYDLAIEWRRALTIIERVALARDGVHACRSN